MTSKTQTKEFIAVKATSVNVTIKSKLNEEETPSQYSREESQRPTLKELEAKVGDPRYCKFHRILSYLTSKCFILKEKIMMLVSEGKITIDQDETAEAYHASVAPNQKKCSRSIFMQFGSLTPIEVDFPRKTLEGSLEIDNHEKNEVDGWTLVTHKKRRHQAVLRIRLPKTRAIRSDVNQLQPSKSVKPCTSQKINGSLSQKVRRPITLNEFFPENSFAVVKLVQHMLFLAQMKQKIQQ
ncbi:hypothetical protein R3W88_022989 [Solanum pinnatisectum]|uniref:Uncharacterized protein n=1 Tax=Solanum pinnatisectum TaxID=50273 RepID=A0AAV9LW71_9SOLN|nr:hypothetical protein R3W88_022989 [Solanum pinnatisectum]